MVIQRTLEKIEELKERPHHERKAIAFYGATITAALLFVLWGFFAVRGLSRTAMSFNAPAQTAGAAASDALPQSSETVASSSNGRVEFIDPDSAE